MRATNTRVRTTSSSFAPSDCNAPSILSIAKCVCAAASVPPIARSPWVAVVPGGQHTCGLTSGGTAYCWGYGDLGQLGAGTPQNTTSPVAVAGGHAFVSLGLGSWHSCGVTVPGVAYCWGENSFGKLGNGSTANSSVPVKVAGQP